MNIELHRVYNRNVFVDRDKINVYDDCSGVAVIMTDNSGNRVSIAFDGLAHRTHEPSGYTNEVYDVFSDCPVMRNGAKVDGRNALIALRDALNKMDLTGNDD